VSRIATPVSLADVAATILDVGGGQSAPNIPGQSLAAHWKSPSAEGAPVISTLTRPPGFQPEWYPIAKGDMHSVVWRGFHWILNGDGTDELYDLALDPWEKENLAARPEHGALRNEMRAIIGRVSAQTQRQSPSQK
jgi:arylsulfatase A-like enzyme